MLKMTDLIFFRCSSAFFAEERMALKQKRQKMRLLQQRKITDISVCKDLPDEIPLPLVIGTKVTGEFAVAHVLQRNINLEGHHLLTSTAHQCLRIFPAWGCV